MTPLRTSFVRKLDSGEQEIATVGFAKARMTASVTVKAALIVTA